MDHVVKPPRRRGARLVNMCVSLLTVLTFVIAAELAVRWIFRDVTTTSDNRSYFAMRWKQQNVRINSWGFRGPESRLTKAAGIYRIAVVGDSHTEGQGVGEEDRFTNVLERRLNSLRGGYEVLNLGRAGAETADHVTVLSNVGFASNPDFVLLQWYVNDVEGDDKSGRPRPWRMLPSGFVVRQLHARSALFYLLNRQWDTMQQSVLPKTYEDYMTERFGDPDSPASRAAQDTLQRFVDACKAYGLPLGIVLFGWSYSAHSRLDFLVDRVLMLCRREELRCVDMRSAFAQHDEGTRLWANRFDSHPGTLAHQLVAEELLRGFADVWRTRREKIDG